jgi:endonuclease YncB( thermonuclease family)
MVARVSYCAGRASLLFGIFAVLVLASAMARAEPIAVDDIVVKDGDSIRARGFDFRMIGYDTPESWTRRRKVGPDERAVAMIATQRLQELLYSGSLDLTEFPCSCSARQRREGSCNHRRKCGLLTLNGKNIGDTLIAEGLAVPFQCSRSKCQKMPVWPTIIKQQMDDR